MTPTLKVALASGALALLSGCASITGDSSQTVRLETYAASGEEVKGAECKLTNDAGTVTVSTPAAVVVHRSSSDMVIDCAKEGQTDAKGTAISRANAGLFGNIIFGGAVGAIIDHSKGTGYSYPQWMKLVFGKFLTFDRSGDKDGQPSVAKEQTVAKPAATVAQN